MSSPTYRCPWLQHLSLCCRLSTAEESQMGSPLPTVLAGGGFIWDSKAGAMQLRSAPRDPAPAHVFGKLHSRLRDAQPCPWHLHTQRMFCPRSVLCGASSSPQLFSRAANPKNKCLLLFVCLQAYGPGRPYPFPPPAGRYSWN